MRRGASRSWPTRKKLAFAALAIALLLTTALVAGELWLRLTARRVWLRSEGILVGCGRTEAGPKYWPNARYRAVSREFAVAFESDEAGYRKRPGRGTAPGGPQVAIIGDSFTASHEVLYEQTFCSLIERDGFRCRNFGVSATGPFAYWHRLVHDVLPTRPDAVVVCLYPGNDFVDYCPDAGFLPDGAPRLDHYEPAGIWEHLGSWCAGRSLLADRLFKTLSRVRFERSKSEGHSMASAGNWWTDPAKFAANRDRPPVVKLMALFRAMVGACREQGVAIRFVVVGPCLNYKPAGGSGPLVRIFEEAGVDAPVLDAAAALWPRRGELVFRLDGHLNPKGHAAIAGLLGEWLASGQGALPADVVARGPSRDSKSR